MELNSVLNFFKTPAGKAVLDHQENEETAVKRREWANTIKVADAEYERIAPPLLATEKEALNRLETIRQKVREMLAQAERDYDAARRRRAQAQEDRHQIVWPAMASLRETCSPKIDRFARVLEDRRASSPEAEHEEGTFPYRHTVSSTAMSIQAAARRINQLLLHDIPALKLLVLTDEELEARFKDIEVSIPEVKMEKIA